MPIVNADVAAVFNKIADLLEGQGAKVLPERQVRAGRSRPRTWSAVPARTDPSRRLAVAHEPDRNRFARQIDRIAELNARRSGMVRLKGVEVEILKDGSLALPSTVLQHPGPSHGTTDRRAPGL